MSARSRLIVAAMSVALLCTAALSAAFDVPVVRPVSVLLSALLAVGSAPVQLVRRIDPSTFVATAIAIGLSAMLLWGFAMAELRWWHPLGSAAVIGVAAAVVHGRVGWQAASELNA